MGGETKSQYYPGYGKNKKFYEAMNDPGWLPDIPPRIKARIDLKFIENTKLAEKFTDMFAGESEAVELAKRAYYKALVQEGTGRLERPAEAGQQ
jgi:hypothetical protein